MRKRERMRERIGRVVQRVGLAVFAIGERIGSDAAPPGPLPKWFTDDLDEDFYSRWFRSTTIGGA